MNGLERVLKVGVKVLVVGWCVVVAKLYSKIQYYQGRIDGRQEMMKNWETLKKDLDKDMNKEEEA